MSELPETFVACAGRVVTCDESRGAGALGAIDDGAVLVRKGRVAMVGPRRDVLTAAGGAPVAFDEPQGLITPGLVDAHTHAAWMGSRHDEYIRRLQGASYAEIAAAGGGIVSTMRAVRAASHEEIVTTLRARLRRMASYGVTTVEVKSGYGLDEASERKQLEAIAEVSRDDALPRIVPTYLALHALPPESKTSREQYVSDVVNKWLPGIAAAGLARFVDAYVDTGAFSASEAARLVERAMALRLGVRLHVGQFADVGGATLAARSSAASVDHLEHVSEHDAAMLAETGVTAVLLPIASFTLNQTPPLVDRLRSVGISMAIASDANPGTAPTESLPLAMALAARHYGCSLDEIILGVTCRAATSLTLGAKAGSLSTDTPADLALWRLPHEAALLQPWGAPPLRAVLRAGRPLTACAAKRDTS